MAWRGFLLWVALTMPCWAAQQERRAGCGEQVLRLQGTIEKVVLTPGAGTPSLEVRGEKGVERVLLGSMRYLMEQNFNPAAGEEVLVEGIRSGDAILAIRLAIPARKVRLELRDEHTCAPKWRHQGGLHGRRRGGR